MPFQPPSSHDTSWQLPLATPRLELRAGTLTFPAPAHCIADNAPGLKLVLVLGGQLDYQLQSGGAVNVEGPAFHISLSDTPFSVSHRYAARQALQYLSVRMPMQALHDTFGAELEALARLAGTNASTLSQGFRQQFGTSVFAYVRQQRLELAYRMLASGNISMADAAHASTAMTRSGMPNSNKGSMPPAASSSRCSGCFIQPFKPYMRCTLWCTACSFHRK